MMGEDRNGECLPGPKEQVQKKCRAQHAVAQSMACWRFWIEGTMVRV